MSIVRLEQYKRLEQTVETLMAALEAFGATLNQFEQRLKELETNGQNVRRRTNRSD